MSDQQTGRVSDRPGDGPGGQGSDPGSDRVRPR